MDERRTGDNERDEPRERAPKRDAEREAVEEEEATGGPGGVREEDEEESR